MSEPGFLGLRDYHDDPAAGVYLSEGHRFSNLPIFPASQLPSFLPCIGSDSFPYIF